MYKIILSVLKTNEMFETPIISFPTTSINKIKKKKFLHYSKVKMRSFTDSFNFISHQNHRNLHFMIKIVKYR